MQITATPNLDFSGIIPDSFRGKCRFVYDQIKRRKRQTVEALMALKKAKDNPEARAVAASQIECRAADLSEVLNRRPVSPMINDIDKEQSSARCDMALIQYDSGYRLLARPGVEDTEAAPKGGLLLQWFDPEHWIWRRHIGFDAYRAPCQVFDRMVSEDPLTQDDVEYWSEVFWGEIQFFSSLNKIHEPLR